MSRADICKSAVYDLEKAIEQLRAYLKRPSRSDEFYGGGPRQAEAATRLVNQSGRRLTKAFTNHHNEEV